MEQTPLPEKLRPDKLSGFVGQKHLAGKDGVVRKLLANAEESNFFPSIIFWGPPGSGKTTLAKIIANVLKRRFHEFSAVNTSIKDIEEIIKRSIQAQETQQMPLVGKKLAPIILIDEIHRFNKAQQDKLLPYVERGNIILIGATTENPSFEVIGPMLSRCRVFTLKQLTEKELGKIMVRATKYLSIILAKRTKAFLLESSNGDARVLLNVLEIASNLAKGRRITLKTLEEALQRRQLTFDRQGEEYYNVISAFIKSMRASNVNAALYYLARMVEAGQDPLYIARRMVVFASEDIGMAQPTALVVANEIFKACETIGYPECQINLAHGTVYLAKAKKDRSAYDAYFKAVEDVKRFGNLPVPLKIRNPVTKLMKELDYGKDYKPYTKEDLLPEKLKGKKYFKE
ncbi:MAG: replication-associated recombination protein A [Microgenomates group bacterium]